MQTPARIYDAQQQRRSPAKCQVDRNHRRTSTADAVYYDDTSDFHRQQYDHQFGAFEDDALPPAASARDRGTKRPQSAKPPSSRFSSSDFAKVDPSQSQNGYFGYQDPTSSQSQIRPKKLPSPYKLKQKVLSSRHRVESTSTPGDSHVRRPSRTATPKESPLMLIASALRQNMQLRDQLLAQLQQEIAIVSSSASHHDRFHPAILQPRLVKMLNKLRSLSLSIVEMILYFQNEVLASTESPASIVHLESELHTYLLKMISSDADFLSCFIPLLRIFDSNGVGLSRNPFVDGLSLDSSELLLCSCNRISSSTTPSSSLFQLLVHKLETFSIGARKHVPTWQVLPPERIAVALLHLIELENHSNATRLLPSYLKPPAASTFSVPAGTSHRAPVQSSAVARLQHSPHYREEAQGDYDIDDFDDEDGYTFREVAVHPRTSIEAWSTDPVRSLPRVQTSGVAAWHGKETAIASDAALDVNFTGVPHVPSTADTSIPVFAELKEHSVIKLPAKKRKGTASKAIDPSDVSIDKQQEIAPARSGEQGLGQSTLTKCETKLSDRVRRESDEAMESLRDRNIVASDTIGTSMHACVEKSDISVESTRPLQSPTRSLSDNYGRGYRDTVVEPSFPAEHAQTFKSPQPSEPTEVHLQTSSHASGEGDRPLEPPVDYHLKQHGKDISDRHSLGEMSVQEMQPGRIFDETHGPLAKILCDSDSSDWKLEPPQDTIDDILVDSRIPARAMPSSITNRWETQCREEMPENSLFEYSSEKTLSMIASALNLLPRFGNLESTVRTTESLPFGARMERSCEETEATTISASDRRGHSEADSSTSWISPPSVCEAAGSLAASDNFDLSRFGSLLAEVRQGSVCINENATNIESREPVLDTIYSLCRDVQVAAYDMSRYHVNEFVAQDDIRSVPEKPCSFGVRYAVDKYEPPRYLERELKMLRRYFRPWKDFSLKQKEAKLMVLQKAARRRVSKFICDSHRARLIAQMELESLRENTAAGRIQRSWMKHRLRVRTARRKGEFKSMHMAFKRFCLFARVNQCRHMRENAKERIHRWWRRRRDAIRKQGAEKARQQQKQQRRMQAAKELQQFFRERSLRLRLARLEAQNQQIMFKERLRATKARQDDEKQRKLESGRRRDVELKMNAALSDLELKWKQTEDERTKLLTHHEQVLLRYQRLEEKRRQQVAQLKISGFIGTCLLRRKIKTIEKEKDVNEAQWRLVTRAKERMEIDSDKWRAKDKVQFRVLQRKLGKLEKEKASLAESQRVLLQKHQQRLQSVQEDAARRTIKAFIDARLAGHKSNKVRLGLLAVQERLTAEREEQERMVCEDISERERVARVEMAALESMVTQAQQEANGLSMQQELLIAEKERDAATSAKMIEESVAEKNRIIISKWIAEQVRDARQKAREDSQKAAYALAIELEKRRRLEIEQQKEALVRERGEEKRGHQIKANLAELQRRKSQVKAQALSGKRQRELAITRICSFVELRVNSSRKLKAVERSRHHSEEQRIQERKFEQELRKHLVEVVIDTRSLVDKLARESIGSAVTSVDRIRAAALHERDRLKHLKKSALARKIQHRWHMWRGEVEIRRKVELARSLKVEAIRRRMHARKIQHRWRRWRLDVETCRKADQVKRQQVDHIYRRACARRIQRRWHGWRLEAEKERKAAHEKHAHLVNIRCRVSARKIQRQWCRWCVRVDKCRKVAEQLARAYLEAEAGKLAKVDGMRRRACARKIQRQWRRWLTDRRERRRAGEIAARLDRLQRRVCGRRILRKWREWRNIREETRVVHAAIVIETVWRGFHSRQQCVVLKQARRHKEVRLFELRLSGLARKIQRCWRQWLRRVIKAKRAIVKNQEDQLILQAKRLRRIHEFAATRIQSRWAGFRCRLIYVGVRKDLQQKSCFQANPDTSFLAADDTGEAICVEVEERQEERLRRTQIFRLGFRLGLQQWVCHQLPHIFTAAIDATVVLCNAVRIVQRAYRDHRNRQRLHFVVETRSIVDDDGGKHSEFHVYFASGRAWMKSDHYAVCQLRFDSAMTRKLLHMFDPGAHTALELRDALEEIVVDVHPLFESSLQTDGSSANELRRTGNLDVDEMDLPNFCLLTRKMGRLRSMHKRKQLAPVRSVSRAKSLTSSQQEFAKLTIFDAVETASVDDAQFLLDQGADLAALEPNTGRTALHLLAFCTERYRFRLDMLKYLIDEAHLDVNTVDSNGDPPLFLFAACGQLELTVKLIDYGADWKVTNSKGQNVLHRACDVDQVEICGYLHQHFGSTHTISCELVPHATLHVPDIAGRYPVHILAEKGFVECAKQFFSATESLAECNRSLLSQRDIGERTPLHLAVVHGHLDMIALFLKKEHGADVNCRDNMRRSPLHLAVDAVNAVGVSSLLASHGADVNAADERGDTALHWAALSGRSLVVQALLDCGADPSIRNSDWEVPAQVAAAYGHFDCVRLLVDAQKQSRGISDDIISLEAELEQQQASGKSYYYKASSSTASIIHVASSSDAVKVEYWEELHQEVQLVEESGNFSSEDEGFLDQEVAEDDADF